MSTTHYSEFYSASKAEIRRRWMASTGHDINPPAGRAYLMTETITPSGPFYFLTVDGMRIAAFTLN